MSAPFTIEATTLTSAPKSAVVDQLLSPGTWPVWQSEIISTDGPQRTVPGDVVQGRAEMLGFRVDGQSLMSEIRDGFVREEVVVGVGMQIVYELEEVDGGTRITHRLSSVLPEGLFGRVLSFFLRRRLRLMQKAVLRHLPEAAETHFLDQNPDSI